MKTKVVETHDTGYSELSFAESALKMRSLGDKKGEFIASKSIVPTSNIFERPFYICRIGFRGPLGNDSGCKF